MPIDFSAPANRNTYAMRTADVSWIQGITQLVDPQGLRVADVGCGGGIYSTTWLQLGAETVVGVDSSSQMIEDAIARADESPNLRFVLGDAATTGLNDRSFDLVFQRALIHHLKDPASAYREVRRVLVPGGTLMIQDRTMEDVLRPGSPKHFRGYFFECFPGLIEFERVRRPEAKSVQTELQNSGFTDIGTHTFAERRRSYTSVDELSADLRARTGRSILHELSDAELSHLIGYILDRVNHSDRIDEIDYWTVWTASTNRMGESRRA